jgi:hypothetical protein
MRRLLLGILLGLLGCAVFAPASQAAFGIEEFALTFENADGTPALQAGSHPFAVTSNVRFHAAPTTIFDEESQNPAEELPEGATKDLDVELPAGLVGDPTAAPRCSGADFIDINEETKEPACSNSSAVGVIVIKTVSAADELAYISAPVYNIAPPEGAVEKLGFAPYGVPIALELDVNMSSPYNVIAKFTDTSQFLPVYGAKLIIWGNPGDPVHDTMRGHCVNASEFTETEELAIWAKYGDLPNGEPAVCHSGVAEQSFVTVPRVCEPLSASFFATSWQDFPAVSGGVAVPTLNGCEHLGFGPTTSAEPTTKAASSPSGLNFSLDVHDEGLTSPTGLAQSDIKRAEVTLPEGMTVNPSAGNGLGACSNADLARETLAAAPGEGCPQSSKLGTVEVETPLLEETLDGSIFVAKPYENEFGTLLAAYMVIKSPKLGVLVKQPLKIVPNPVTGQLTTVAYNIPQLPFSHFRLKFRGGEGAPLITPQCGTHGLSAVLTPWDGGPAVTSTSTFEISSGPGGGPCAAPGAAFGPQIQAGTLNNSAGGFSPFYLQLTRSDSDQEFTNFSTTLPLGLAGVLTGIPFCPEANIAQARTKSGLQEQASPSCPAASLLGHTEVGAGVGSQLTYVPGKLYLAGPYQGDPFSLVSVTPVVVGPFDLGAVVLRFGLHIDPRTAQVSIDPSASEPIPHILQGIVTHIRDIRVTVDRPNFTFNPTSCTPSSIAATVIGAGANFASPADDQSATATSRFQAADCQALKFKPSFKVSTSGKTSKAGGASLSVKLAFPPGSLGTEANIAKVKVDLPKQLPSRLTTLQKACLAATFEANPAECPAASIIGHAKAITPILPVPIEGPAYFVSHGGEAFPSLVMVLQGYGVTIDLTATTFISKAGITSSTFKAVPDQPVSSFELTLPEGKYSALAANGNLCSSKLAMPTAFTAQNGAEIHESTPIAVEGCSTSLSFTHEIEKRTVTLRVSAPAAGRITASGKGLVAKSETAKGRESLTITLKQKHAGKLKTRVKVAFTPSAGKDRKKQAKSAKLTFKK